LRKVMIARSAHGPAVREIILEARRLGIVVQLVDVRHLPGGPEAQGVVALASVRPTVQVEDILAAASARGEPPFVLVLDGVEDPTNLGALIRTADGAGVHGVIIPRHRAVGLTPAVARASAGAVEYVPVAVVGNLVQTLEELKRAGLWIVGADMEAPQRHHEASLMPPLAVVVGGEGRGLGRLVREHCDLVVSLPMRGRTASLNVSVAAGILLYEVVRRIAETGAGGGASRSRGVGTE
jgi:23S rRNA (guanosine2251-2'-O)-methyltransferase